MSLIWKRVWGRKQGDVAHTPADAARPVSAPTDAPAFNEPLETYPEYDYVILGGGTAGCVLAARLSEDPTKRVLLLEAGGAGSTSVFSRIPLAAPNLFGTPKVWNLHTTPQAHAEQRELFWPRGRLLGGCSSINAMMFHYGCPDDFDEWARLSNDDQWSWKQFQRYFAKFEAFTAPASSSEQLTGRATDGPIQTGLFGHFSNWAQKFIQSGIQAGFQPRGDFNTSDGTLGIGQVLSYITSSGLRSSSETGYLTPKVLARPNLTVLTNAHITRILLSHDKSTGVKRAVGVEFASGAKKTRYRVQAKQEVIVSCGSVHTPHILMLSGIGPSDHLESKGIPVLHHLSGVGQNLLDHLVVHLRFRVEKKESLNKLGIRGWRQLYAVPSLVEWFLYGTGPMVGNYGEGVAFLRSNDRTFFDESDPAFQDKIEDTTSGENAPDIELIAIPMGWWNHGLPTSWPVSNPMALASIAGTLLRPTSKGEITLKSSDPFDAPIINPNYLSTPHDLAVLRRALRLLLRISLVSPLSTLIDRTETDPILDQNLHNEATDERLDSEIRKRCETLYHPTSTARMAPLENGGVVDSNLRVYGIEGLRIVDASVFPTINSGHTTAPVLALAEKAADLILGR